MIIIVLIAFTAVAFFEVPGLIQKKYWPELIVFSVLLLTGLGLSILLLKGVNLPYIADLIGHVIKKVFK